MNKKESYADYGKFLDSVTRLQRLLERLLLALLACYLAWSHWIFLEITSPHWIKTNIGLGTELQILQKANSHCRKEGSSNEQSFRCN